MQEQRYKMKWLLCVTSALWCLFKEMADAACDGNSTQSDSYFTIGSYALARSPCCFPFTYKGIIIRECTLLAKNVPWCSVDSEYDGVWGPCLPDPIMPGGACIGHSTQSTQYHTKGGTVQAGTPCCFPFWYKGDWHSSCIRIDHNQPWCSSANVYGQEQWGNCQYDKTAREPSTRGTTVFYPSTTKVPRESTNSSSVSPTSSKSGEESRSLIVGITVPVIIIILIIVGFAV